MSLAIKSDRHFVEKCRKEEDNKGTLNTVPETLEATYRKILHSFERRDVPLALAAMVDLEFPASVLVICTTSLVSEFDDKVQVAHFFVQKFLVVSEEGGQHHECQFSVISGHRFLATKTVNSLLEQINVLTETAAKELPSFIYTAKYWDTHVVALGDIDRLCPESQAKIHRLFTEPNVYFNWGRIADSDNWHVDSQWSKMPQDCEPPIHRPSRIGLHQTVEELLNRGAGPDVNAQGGEYGNTLQAASSKGHEKVAQTLLDRGADINAQGGRYRSALQIASSEG
ncbi:hypothetical protein N7467_006521 [Penicillium canescens]|nr:hypothetical protein N7467_006521 [Penicillium canescens]